MITKEMLEELTIHLSKHIRTSECPRCDEQCPTSPHHLLWMCEQVKHLDNIKAALWTGYIHGIMLMNQMVSIEEEQRAFWNYDRP